MNANVKTYCKTTSKGEAHTICNEHDEYPPVYLHVFKVKTTDQLNFISWNKAYSVLPRYTFMKKKVRFLTPSIPAVRLARHVEDDIDQVKAPDGLVIAADDFARTNRRVGDSDTWVMELDVKGVEEIDIPNQVLELTMFVIKSENDASEQQPKRYVLMFEDMYHAYVKHVYVVSRLFLPGIPYWQATDKIDKQLRDELLRT